MLAFVLALVTTLIAGHRADSRAIVTGRGLAPHTAVEVEVDSATPHASVACALERRAMVTTDAKGAFRVVIAPKGPCGLYSSPDGWTAFVTAPGGVEYRSATFR